jgi:hypothetical protein
MYCIWILIGIPFASLVCAAFIVVREGKGRLANEAVHRTLSTFGITPLSKTGKADDWNSENTLQVLIGILNNSSNDGLRVTIREATTYLDDGRHGKKYLARSDDKAWTRSTSKIWPLKLYGELLFLDRDSSTAEVGLIKGESEINQNER